MQAAEPSDVDESFFRLLQGSAAQTASGHAFGHSQQQQQAWPAQNMEPRVPGADHSLRLESMKNLGLSSLAQQPSPPRREPPAGSLWAPNPSGNSNAWGGSLWSGSNDNIWSTSKSL